MRRPRAVLAVAVTGLLLSACASDSEAEPRAGGGDASPAASASPEPTAEAVDPASAGANELGQIPVMMYHQVKENVCDQCVYDQTPEEFREELQRMYDADFRPITVAQLISGEFDVPAGKRPVVLTFDDSSASQIQIDESGELTPNTAVAIMEEFEEENPDWVSTGSFYVNSNAFEGDDAALTWLTENGYEVGVHTMQHTNLKQASEAAVQEAIGGNVAEVQEIAPEATMSTISLPFGISPGNKALLESGSYEGEEYTLDGALLVGSNPSPSVFSAKFDPYAIPRIRSGPKDKPVETDSTYWLDLLDDGKWTPFVSDGDPEKVSFPDDTSVEISPDWEDKANAYPASDAAEEESGDSAGATPEATSESTPEADPEATDAAATEETSTEESTEE